jgi:hypothetical protein
MNIAMIETFAFNMMNKRKNVNLFSIILKDVKKHFEKHSKSNIVVEDVFSFEYHEFFDVFDKKVFNTFVSHRFYDHKIVLKKDIILDYTSLYKMFEKKLKIVKEYFKNNLKKTSLSRTDRSLHHQWCSWKKTIIAILCRLQKIKSINQKE